MTDMKKFAYVGCRTTKERNARGKGIKVFDAESWELLQTLEGLVNPSYLCFDRTGNFLYTIHGDFSEISLFRVDRNNGRISLLNTASTGGVNPVHLSVDAGNRWVFVANLQTGTVAVIPRNDDGTLGTLKELYTMPGKSDGTVSHPHQVMQDNTGRFLIVSCQGRKAGFGQVDVFRIDGGNGMLEKTCTVRSREIAEPRHVAFHANNKYCYGVNEKDYSVTFYEFDQNNGTLTPKQILPTLPETYTGDGWASGIIMTNDSRHVIVSNRKHDSITSFSVSPENGMLKFADCIKTGGGQPRFITLDPEGRILAANETTDTLTFFTVDGEGKFSRENMTVETESPVCVVFG